MARLKGKNLAEQFQKVADRLVSRISRLEGVAGIVFTGGLVRNFADRFSDVDIIVFLSKRDGELRRQIRRMGLDESQRSDLDVDLEIHLLSDFEKRKLDEVALWDFCMSRVTFDPCGDVGRVLKRKLQVSKSFWVKRLAVYAEYLKWYCCPPKEGVGTVTEAWIERGDLVSAHYCLSYALDLVLGILYVLNREFLPAPKWRVFYSHNLEWLPVDYANLVEEAIIVKSLSTDDISRRMTVIKKLWDEIVPRIKRETGFTLDLLTEYYIKNVLHQTLQ